MTIRQITNAVPILLIRFYQVALSPLFPPSCRFEPSCSRYGLEAFRTHHFFKAFGLTVWRVLRCNPFVKGGYDPVPSGDASPVLSSDASNPPHTCQAHKH